MRNDSAGDTSRRSGNSPAIIFSTPFHPLADPPDPLDLDGMCAKASELGFSDSGTSEASYLFERMGYQYASEYFSLFPEPTSLRDVHRAAIFDRKLRALFMEYIGLFEVTFKARYSLAMTERYGAFAHRDPAAFRNRRQFDNYLRIYADELGRQISGRNSAATKAYELYGDAPTWLAVEIMSFGTISKLYGNTRDRAVRHGVADAFGVMSDTLASWTKAISAMRNRCAHFNKVLGTPLSSRPRRIGGLGYADNESFFYIVLVLIRLLNNESFVFGSDMALNYAVRCAEDFGQLFYDHGAIATSAGLPNDWLELMCDERVIGVKVQIDPVPEKTGMKLSFTIGN